MARATFSKRRQAHASRDYDLSHVSPREEEFSSRSWSKRSGTALLKALALARPDLLRCAILGRAHSRNTKREVENQLQRRTSCSWFCSWSGSCSFFYSKCKYTLGIFFWDSFFMLHADSFNVHDLRREVPASLEARFTADRSTFSKKTSFLH